jgi:hypothetical protein
MNRLDTHEERKEPLHACDMARKKGTSLNALDKETSRRSHCAVIGLS